MRWIAALAIAWSVSAHGGTDPDSIIRRQSRYFYNMSFGMAFCDVCEVAGKATGYFTTIHGVRLAPKVRLGIGIGMTSAAERLLIPIFGNLSVDLAGKKKNKMVGDLSYGTAPSPPTKGDFLTETVSGTSFFQPSIGYAMVYNDVRVTVLVGMQALRLKRTITYPSNSWGWGMDRQATPSHYEFEYNVTRFHIGMQVGWRN